MVFVFRWCLRWKSPACEILKLEIMYFAEYDYKYKYKHKFKHTVASYVNKSFGEYPMIQLDY